VSDHGIGIAAKDIPKIFDRFYRADKARTSAANSGYGLGLSIAKKIVTAHHGTISVKSAPGKGTEFLIRLPVTETA
jgi:two-component system sensor histidine kinase ResE